MTPSRRRLNIVLAAAASIVCLSTAGAAFWYQDWRYSLPTPKPEGLRQPGLGTAVDLEAVIGRRFDGRAVAIHVVNPDCPCSRFNRDHLRTLVRRFGDRVAFVALVQGGDDPRALERSFARWNIPTEVIADPRGDRARMLGVYSTPQAVIVTAGRRLYFRGNYNSTRYCVDARTEFARLALESLLAGVPLPDLPDEAGSAYGCPLRRPADRKL